MNGQKWKGEAKDENEARSINSRILKISLLKTRLIEPTVEE